MIDVTNEIVRPNDYLIFLGDFCLNTKSEQFDAYLDRIKCQNIIFIWGNHNNPHEKYAYTPIVKKILGSSYQDGSEIYPVKYKNVTYYGHCLKVILDGQFVILSHFPHYIWDEMQHGAWMLCGHSHYGCELTRAENLYGKILDVGWDGHGKPYSLKEIQSIMDGKRFKAVDHHT